MSSRTITAPDPRLRAAQKARTRALVVPREHGAWGLLLVPLFTGVAVGAASVHHAGPVALFALAALALFWLRTPVESLLGTTPLSAQSREERWTALIVAAGLGAVSFLCLAGLLWNGRNRELWLLGSIAGLAFAGQTWLMKSGRKLRMSAQIVGAIGLSCTAPAAYVVATGHLDVRAWWLWAANWIFAGNQIHFVQLRIHAARAATFAEKYAQGRWFFLAQVLVLLVLAIAMRWHLLPTLALVAFLPALARGFYWFSAGRQRLEVKSLGWSEMRQGVLFGVLLAAAGILP
jgi:hypothetical protein